MEGGTDGVDGGGRVLQKVHDVVGIVYLVRREGGRKGLEFRRGDILPKLPVRREGKKKGGRRGEGGGNGERDERKRLSFPNCCATVLLYPSSPVLLKPAIPPASLLPSLPTYHQIMEYIATQL